jgi:hypothetical protein
VEPELAEAQEEGREEVIAHPFGQLGGTGFGSKKSRAKLRNEKNSK